MTVAENVETLPQPCGGNYEVARFNALRHGVLSQHTVLPWEDKDEYRALIEALVAEHSPQGPTEEHLVEELAGIFWRKRRLRSAESAVHHRALKRAIEPHQETTRNALIHIAAHDEIEPIGDAIRATEAQTAEDLADLEKDETMTENAIRLLKTLAPSTYTRAVATLRDDTRAWWEDQVSWQPDDYEEGETPFQPNAESLRRFVERLLAPDGGGRGGHARAAAGAFRGASPSEDPGTPRPRGQKHRRWFVDRVRQCGRRRALRGGCARRYVRP